MAEKKETRGRRLIGETPRLRRTVNIDESDWTLLHELGNGNKSEGLHVLCERTRKQRDGLKSDA